MSEGAARPVGFGAALAEQLRWFWLRQRVWIVLLTALVSVAAAWLIVSIPEEQRFLSIVIVGASFHWLLVLIALSWAMSTWRDDPPKDRQYFWLHPVSRTGHTIARSVAGYLWLLAITGVILAVIVSSIAIGGGGLETAGTPVFWLYILCGISLAYIAGSIAPLLSDKPGVWLAGALAIVILADIIATLRQIEWLAHAVEVFKDGRLSLMAALNGPSVEAVRMLGSGDWADAIPDEQVARIAEATPGTALLIWLPVAIVVYLAAVRLSRPR